MELLNWVGFKSWIGESEIYLWGVNKYIISIIEDILKENVDKNNIVIIDNAKDRAIEKLQSINMSYPVITQEEINFDKNIKIIVCIKNSGAVNDVKCYLNLNEMKIWENYIIMNELIIEDNSHYAKIEPNATYAPWVLDREFMDTYSLIKNNTLVDIYRCSELWNLAKQVGKLEEGAYIEIGVWRGGTGALIARSFSELDIKEKIYLCDTFSGVVKSSDADLHYNNGEHSDTKIEIVEDLLDSLNISNAKILRGIFPDDTEELLEDDKFRFVHIDVDVYQSAKDILEFI